MCLDHAQPNVANNLDKNVNMTKFVLQSVSLDKSFVFLPTKNSFNFKLGLANFFYKRTVSKYFSVLWDT